MDILDLVKVQQTPRRSKKKDSLSALLRHSRENLLNGRALRNEDGSLSTIRSGSINDPRLNDGKPTLIPFIYDGRQVELGEAIERAIESGKKFPSFENHEQATATSKWLSQQLPATPEAWKAFKGLQGAPF